jgi:hypothetical protein
MSRENSAQRMTACPHEQAILLDGVAGRPAVKHNGWPNGQKTVDAETLSGNCCIFTHTRRIRVGVGAWLRVPIENYRITDNKATDSPGFSGRPIVRRC